MFERRVLGRTLWLLLLVPSLLTGQPSADFEITEVNVSGADLVVAAAVNESRQVVGWFYPTGSAEPRAFVWSDGTAVPLQSTDPSRPTEAFDINDAGWVVGGEVTLLSSRGFVGPQPLRALLWRPSSNFAPEDLGSLQGGDSTALGINDLSPPTIVGSSTVTRFDQARSRPPSRHRVIPQTPVAGRLMDGLESNQRGNASTIPRAFRWRNGTMTMIANVLLGVPPEPGPVLPTVATDVNDRDQASGYGSFDAGDRLAMFWDANDEAQIASLLPVDDPEEDTVAQGLAINAFAQVAGWSNSNVSATSQGLVFDPLVPAPDPAEFQSAVPLDGLIVADGFAMEGDLVGLALDLNDQGVVVGTSTRVAGSPPRGPLDNRAVRWVGGVPEDLNDLVAGSGWRLVEASGINETGCIVGNGFNPQGQQRGFLLCGPSAATAVEVPFSGLALGGLAGALLLVALLEIRRRG